MATRDHLPLWPDSPTLTTPEWRFFPARWTSELTGEGPVPAETRSDELQAQEPDPRKIIRGWGKLTTEVAPRIAPVLLLIRSAAATDPEMAALRAEMDTGRLTRMTSNARNLAEGGHLRDDITAGHAGEVL